MAMSRKDVSRYEAIVAISDAFHRPKAYGPIYKAIGPQLGGFPGIWEFVALMADVFIKYTEKNRIDWNKYEYIESMWYYVDKVQKELLDDNFLPALPGTAGEGSCRKVLEDIVKETLIKV